MLCLIVCLSVISQCSIETADFRHRGCPQLILCSEGIQVSPTIRVLPSGILSQTLNFADFSAFLHGTLTVEGVVSLV